MSSLVTYVLDANVFIEAKRRYYAFDLCPDFWDALVWNQAKGRVVSIDRIKEELLRGGDDLADWVTSTMPSDGFASTDEQGVVEWFGRMVAWVQAEPQFSPEAKAQFAREPDGWLVAYAKAKGHVLVTHEVLARDAKKNVPIPNVCQAFNVPFMDSFEMLKTLTVLFTWRVPT